jgi:hypothetical protein
LGISHDFSRAKLVWPAVLRDVVFGHSEGARGSSQLHDHLADIFPFEASDERPHRLADLRMVLQDLMHRAVKDLSGASRFLRRTVGNQDELAGLGIVISHHAKRLTG